MTFIECTKREQKLPDEKEEVVERSSLQRIHRPRGAESTLKEAWQGPGSNVRSPNPELREVLDQRGGGVRSV